MKYALSKPGSSGYFYADDLCLLKGLNENSKTLTGTINLANFSGDITTVPLTINLTGASTKTFTVYPNASGVFTVSGIAPGIYNVKRMV